MNLADAIRSCTRCPLGEAQEDGNKPVPLYLGPKYPKRGIAVVCDFPRYYDSRAGKPLQGKDGGMFDRLVAKVGLTRDMFLLTNSVRCIAPESLVLTADLRWVRADSIGLGDHLVGFDEYPAVSRKGARRRLKVALVDYLQKHAKPRVRISLADGRQVVVSEDHRWLATKDDKTNLHWVEAGDLQPGSHRLRYLVRPWKTDSSYEAGWLAGFADGEGNASKDGFVITPGVQVLGPTFDMVCQLLADKGFGNRSYTTLRPDRTKPVGTVKLRTIEDGFRFLGQIRPERLLSKRAWVNGSVTSTAKFQTVDIVHVERLGDGPVVSIGTTTNTLVVDGLLSHNCKPANNRIDDYPEAINACAHWTQAEFEAYDPAVVVLMGRVAIRSVFGAEATVAATRGTFSSTPTKHPWGNRLCICTYHPGAAGFAGGEDSDPAKHIVNDLSAAVNAWRVLREK